MAKKIKVVLNTDTTSAECGQFSVDANGYNGKGCDVDVAAFQNLGATIKANKKPEWKQVQTGRVSVNA
jgi:hypothetical protein